MRSILVLFISLFLTTSAHALSLIWEYGGTGTVEIQRSVNPAGPWTTIATVPAGQLFYPLPAADGQWYRVNSAVGASNVVQHAPILTDIVSSTIQALEARLTALEAPPAPLPNLSATPIDADHIEILGGNCVSLRTTGSGLRRVVECVH